MEIKYLRYFLAVAREENRTMKFLPGPVIILKDCILKVHSACLITDLFLHRKVSESSGNSPKLSKSQTLIQVSGMGIAFDNRIELKNSKSKFFSFFDVPFPAVFFV